VVILNTAYFGALTAISFIAQSDQAKNSWASQTRTCTDSAVSLTTQLANAQVSLNNAEAQGGDVTQARLDLAAAQVQLGQFTNMCGCMTQTLSKLEPLNFPGIVGFVSCIFAFITINSLCCSMGCCNGDREEDTPRDTPKKQGGGTQMNPMFSQA